MSYKVIILSVFEKLMKKHDIPVSFVQKLCDSLEVNPWMGRVLGPHNLREKRYWNKRVYWLCL